jgi:hypothetical protein
MPDESFIVPVTHTAQRGPVWYVKHMVRDGLDKAVALSVMTVVLPMGLSNMPKAIGSPAIKRPARYVPPMHTAAKRPDCKTKCIKKQTV